MKKYMVSAALVSAMIATPAMARDGYWYAGIEGGVLIPEDTQIDFDIDTAEASIDQETGYDVDLLLGRDFGAFRLELEGAYKSSDIQEVTSTGAGIPFDGTPVFAVGTFDADGSVDVLSGMLNGLIDLGGNDGIGFYAGGGIGVARVNADYTLNNSTVGAFVDDDETNFAWQLIAGLRFPLSESVDLGLKYRYFNTDEVDLVDNIGRDATLDLETHSVLASLLLNFGGPAAVAPPPPPAPVPAPPPPPPPAPPAPQPVTCNTGPYIVFFDWDESVITPAASQILDSAITAYGDCGMARIMLAGYTDTSGSQAYNLGLAARRNASVRDYLTARSVPDARITSEAFGEENLRVPTADGVRELQNRRVEITYGPGSGM